MSRRRAADELPSSLQECWGDLRADYDAGSVSRYLPSVKGTLGTGSGADYHYRNEVAFFRCIERMRNYDRNNMVVGQGINRAVANVVQDGFTPDPLTPDKGANQAIKDRWYAWAEDPAQADWEEELTFVEQEQLVFRSTVLDGDEVALLTDAGSIQHFESHRLRTPRATKRNVVHGVLLDERGRRQQYWLTKRDIDPLSFVRQVNEIQPFNVRDEEGERVICHTYFRKWLSQTRGVPALAPAIYPVNFHDDLQFAQLVKAQVASCFAIIEEVGEFAAPDTSPSAATGAQHEETLIDGTRRTSQGLVPGMRIKGQKGHKLTGFTPNVPNQEFFQHAELILTFIAINLDLPVAVLLLDPSNTNFSGWRGAIDEARKRFRVLQRNLIRKFHRPVYRWKLRHFMAEDAVLQGVFKKHGKKIFDHAWHPPTWTYIEPHKDISANALELATLQTSPRRQRARQGEEFAEILPEFVNDAGLVIRLCKQEAAAINTQFPSDEPITWQDVLRVFTAKGITVSSSSSTDPASDQPPPQPKGTAA